MQTVYKSILSEAHKQLRLYLTVPITTATSERTFSALHVLLYLRSTMTEKIVYCFMYTRSLLTVYI